MSDIIHNELDGVIQEEETSNEFDDVPITDEPDDDESEQRKSKSKKNNIVTDILIN